MLEVYDSSAKKLVACEHFPEAGWVHAFEPTPSDLKAIVDAGVPEEFLEHVMDVDEAARIEHDRSGATLFILRVPWRRKKKKLLPYRSESFGVVLLPNRIVTVARHETRVVDMVVQKNGLDDRAPIRLALMLAAATAECFLEDLRKVSEAVDEVEERLGKSMSNAEVLQLLQYQKALVHFTQAIGANHIVLERLAKDAHLKISTDDQELIEDVMVELHQANELASISSGILSSMMDAFASIISNNLNVVMKVLTSLTIILTGPILIASLYGMNVGLPGASHPHAFIGIVVGSILLGLGVATAFRRLGWL
jgi:magnesium transporter